MAHKGKVIYFKGTYGYISSPDYSYKLFFHRLDVKKDYVSIIKRGDEVGFETIPNPRKVGFEKAINIKFIRFRPPTLNSLGIKEPDPKYMEVGKLLNWNGRAGHIKCPNLEDKDTFLYYTRLLAISIGPQDILVFQPLESRDQRSNYFAYFAYPIASAHKEVLFDMFKENTTTSNPLLDTYLETHYPLEYLLSRILKEANQRNLSVLVKLVKEFINQYGQLSEDFIKQLPNEIQIFLWEQKLLGKIPDALFLLYFRNMPYADKARHLDLETSDQRKKWILNDFVNWFIDTRQFFKIKQELKPFLILLHKNFGVAEEFLTQLVQVVFQMLPPDRIIDLWLNSYVKKLPSIDFLLQHFDFQNVADIENLLSLPGDVEFAKKARDAAFNYMCPELLEKDFNQVLPGMIKFLIHYRETEMNLFSNQILPSLKQLLTPDHLLKLKCMGAHIDLDPLNLLKNCKSPINLVFLIYYDSRSPGIFTKNILLDYLENSTLEERLKSDLLTFPWNDLLGPAAFLKNIFNTWNLKERFFPQPDADAMLSVHIFDGLLPKYTVHHLRLYIQYPDELKDRLDFFGFTQSFKELTRDEKQKIRDALNQTIQNDITLFEKEEVQPCTDLVEKSDHTIYYATILNIYFSLGYFALRLPDRSYTKIYDKAPWVTPGLNHIPTNHTLAKMPLKIIVTDNSIREIDGLAELKMEIQNNDIVAILTKIETEGELVEGDIDYPSDLSLKKRILKFLQENQMPGMDALPVYEYAAFYSRVKDNSDARHQLRKYLCHVYSMEQNNEIAIIWEGAEFDEISATFIFKTPFSRHKELLDRISYAIESYKNLRSYLISTFNSNSEIIRSEKREIQQKLRNYLGYVGNVRKRRGIEDAFQRWEEGLKKMLQYAPPADLAVEFEPEIIDWGKYGLIIHKGYPHEKPQKKRVKKVNIKHDPNTGDYSFEVNDDVISQILADLIDLNAHFLQNINL